MTIRHELITKLQDEVIFLQGTKHDEDVLETYHYELKGDLSEKREFVE